jgi:hypothetical protein
LAEWPSGLGKGLQSPVRGFDSRFRLGRLAQLGERFPDTEEVTSSSLVPPTRTRRSQASSRTPRAGLKIIYHQFGHHDVGLS